MTVTVGHDSAKTRQTLSAGGKTVAYYSIPAAQAAGLGDFARLPAALKVVLENMLRFEDGKTEIGRASCRERVSISGVAVSLKQTISKTTQYRCHHNQAISTNKHIHNRNN